MSSWRLKKYLKNKSLNGVDSFYVRVVNLQWDDFDSYRWFFRSVVDETKGHEDSQFIIRKALVF